MRWKAAKSFYADLAATIAKLFVRRSQSPTAQPGETTDAETAAAGLSSSRGFNLFEVLPSLVRETDALTTMLLSNTTDLSADDLDSLDYGDVLSLLDAALEVNLDDEIKNSCAGVVARVRGFYAAAPANKNETALPTT